MLYRSAGRVLLVTVCFVHARADVPRPVIRLSQQALLRELTLLNESVDGRLFAVTPWELPCFSNLNGVAVARNDTECAAIQANYTNPLFRATHFGAYMIPEWETCQTESPSGGCLLDPSDPSDPLAFDKAACHSGNLASYFIDVRYYTDVQKALRFSEMTGIRLSVKNKGHDYKGRSSGKGTLALWVSNLDSISYEPEFVPEGCSTSYDAVTIGPGVLTQTIYEYADAVNKTFIGGYSQSVGAGGGFFLGGGHSVLSPVYGLAVDRVVQVKVVTANGQYLVANECSNTDLFFALRGGGGSAFGVVMESSHRLEPQLTLQVASLNFTGHSNLSTLAIWYETLVNETYKWGTQGWGGHIVGPTLIFVNSLLSNADAKASMRTAADFALAQGGTAIVEELPSYLAFFNKYVTLAEASVGPELILGSRLIPTSLFESAEGRETLSSTIAGLLSFASPYIPVVPPFLYNYTEGTTSVTPAWRRSLWHLSLHSVWSWNSSVDYIQEQYEAVTQHVQQFRDITPGSGAYFNEGDVYEPNHPYSYWGNNYERLLSIKKRYDPVGLLDCWQCVGWKGENDPLYQCYLPYPVLQ